MIKIEVINSTDELALGVYEYAYDMVFIGRSSKCDLIFSKDEFPLKFLTITANEKYLLIASESNSPHYFVNNKKTTGAFKLKHNDIITFGNHSVKILDYKMTVISEDLSAYYEKISEAGPEVRETLKFLEDKLIELEEAN